MKYLGSDDLGDNPGVESAWTNTGFWLVGNIIYFSLDGSKNKMHKFQLEKSDLENLNKINFEKTITEEDNKKWHRDNVGECKNYFFKD